MSEHTVTLTVNGTDAELRLESRTLLVHALRDELGYTGPKVGCESGKCGACTVHVDGEAVKSCTMLAVQADGADVRTVEGIAPDAATSESASSADETAGSAAKTADGLHPIQRAFHEEHGLQCGYCTPGMVMTTAAVLEDDPDPTRDEIRTALKGNVCRCTGYQNVVSAVETAAAELDREETAEAALETDGSGGDEYEADGSRGDESGAGSSGEDGTGGD